MDFSSEEEKWRCDSHPERRTYLLVIFGGTSVGKTALLREVLSQERYHVVYFDLRVAGSADLKSLFFALTVQFEICLQRLRRRRDMRTSIHKRFHSSMLVGT